jgi:hypothetical protein
MIALKIIQCKDPSRWYSAMVGQIVPLVGCQMYGEYTSREPNGLLNVVWVEDAEIVDVDD